MKNLYIPALALFFVSGPAVAQQATNNPLPALKQRLAPSEMQLQHPNSVERSANREVIWSDDFSNPDLWEIGNTYGNNDNWVIGTQGPSGAYAINPINSTTASNGFALFDSDLMCSGQQNGWLAIASPIDLSAYPGAVLQFEQYYRQFEGTCWIDASTDGTNWTSFQVNADVAVNNSTPNPDLRAVNLTSVVGGASTAWFRFRYEGVCDYSWMVDDVELVTLPDYELINSWGYVVPFGGGYEYGRIPQLHMPSTVSVGAQIVNFGGQEQTNVSVTATMEGPDGSQVDEATFNVSSGMLNSDTVITESTLNMPEDMPLGIYTVTFTISSDNIDQDDNPNNNTSVRYFEVTEDLYSLDGMGVYPEEILSLATLGTASFIDNSQDVRFLNLTFIEQPTTALGVEVQLDVNNSDAGSYFIATLYDTTEVWEGDLNALNSLGESDLRVITSADLNAGVAYVDFIEPIELQPEGYFVGVRMYQEAGNDLYILDDLTVDEPFDATMLWIPNDDNHLYSNGNAMGIRLVSRNDVSVQEHPGLTGVTVYPSPTEGPVTIEVDKPGKMEVEVFNLLGELVHTTSFNGTSTVVDLTNQPAGVYTIRVNDGNGYNVQRITRR